jgi:hypothetical protein
MEKPAEACRYPTPTEATAGGYECVCHKRLGNKFWLLPSEECATYEDNKDAVHNT